MLTWLQSYKTAERETKLFIFTVLLYTLAVIVPTIICYARLDSVRSYVAEDAIIEVEQRTDK